MKKVWLALFVLSGVLGVSNLSSADTTTSSTSTSVTVSAVGDTELGATPHLPNNAATYFNAVRTAVRAPLQFANLEGTFASGGPSKCGHASTDCYAFRVPPSFAKYYANAGFNVLNSANNHSYDFGALGVAQTSAAMRAAGITQAGLPGQIGYVSEGPVRVAFVDFAPYSLTNNLLDFGAARRLIATARAHAALVVVYMHAGAEGPAADHVTRATEYYVGENRGNPYAFAHMAINAGADLVLGSGPHVLRGMQWYRGHLIVYSLGDFANYFDFSASGDMALSGVVHVTLSATGEFLSGSFTSLRLAPSGYARVDKSNAARVFVNQLSREDFASSAAMVAPDGSISAP